MCEHADILDRNAHDAKGFDHIWQDFGLRDSAFVLLVARPPRPAFSILDMEFPYRVMGLRSEG